MDGGLCYTHMQFPCPPIEMTGLLLVHMSEMPKCSASMLTRPIKHRTIKKHTDLSEEQEISHFL